MADAVASARRALRNFAGPREAIIACYTTMEKRLAEAGAVRSGADTPEELLGKVGSLPGIGVPAAQRLTALYYEARFSRHELHDDLRNEAERALADLEPSPRPGTSLSRPLGL
ncbi:MAG TPA: DUF4129 domain-containing protein [Acidimicrobiales bacterium]|nr:DUF4129 domain-containing protein [Acidimicrobiales bacterium]